jgi:hypothetical protein
VERSATPRKISSMPWRIGRKRPTIPRSSRPQPRANLKKRLKNAFIPSDPEGAELSNFQDDVGLGMTIPLPSLWEKRRRPLRKNPSKGSQPSTHLSVNSPLSTLRKNLSEKTLTGGLNEL